MSEIERLAKVLQDTPPSGSPPGFYMDYEAQVRALLRELAGRRGWAIDTDEGRQIMERRRAAYVAVCRQRYCDGRVPGIQGDCAACADVADHVIEAWLGSLLGEPSTWYDGDDLPSKRPAGVR